MVCSNIVQHIGISSFFRNSNTHYSTLIFSVVFNYILTISKQPIKCHSYTYSLIFSLFCCDYVQSAYIFMLNHHLSRRKIKANFTLCNKVLTLKDPFISESCIEIKIELNVYFHSSLWCPKRFYEGL